MGKNDFFGRFLENPLAYGTLLFIFLAALIYGLGQVGSGLRSSMVTGDYAAAYNQAMRAAKAGDKQAQNTLGNLYYLGLGVGKDFEKAAYWYRKSALAGYSPAQVNMGHLYSKGFGVTQDATKTLGWYWLAKISGYEEVEDHVQIKLDELQLVPGLIQKAQDQFSSLEKVQQMYAKCPDPFCTKAGQ